MTIERSTVYTLYVMIWLTQNFYCRAGVCGPRKPVVKICTEDTLFMQTSANIDTAEAPKLQQSSCKCTLSPTHPDVPIYFNYYRKPSPNMEFAVKGAKLNKEAGTNMKIKGDTDLMFTQTENAVDGACLIVSRRDRVSKFNITCTTRTTKVTTDPSTSTSMKDVAGSKSLISSTSTELITDRTEQQQVETEDENTSIVSTSTEHITDRTEQQQVEIEGEKTSIVSTSTEHITDRTEQQQVEIEGEKTSIVSTSTEHITDRTEQQQVEIEGEKTSIVSTSTEHITDRTEQQQVEIEGEKTSIVSTSTEHITDRTEQQQVEIEGEKTSISSTSTEILTDLTEQHLETEENGKDKSFLIPALVSVSGCVCLVIVAGILYRRRKMSSRRVSTPRNSKAETKNESDYYMTENPMYNMTDTPQNTHTSENEYSFVEHENQEDGITTNQYESLPDSPVGTRISSKPSGQDQEYDYTVCSSASKKYKTADEKQNKTEVKQRKPLPNDKPYTDDTVYDRTDVVAKQFNSSNEYSHLPNTVSKKAADDTYNTLGNSYKT